MSEAPQRTRLTAGPFLARVFLFIVVLLVGGSLLYAGAFGPTDKYAATDEFIINPDESMGKVASDLAAKGFVRNPLIFQIAYLREADGRPVLPGGYKISKSMDAWTIASQLVEPPYAAWVTIPVGVRKEQIGDILAKALGWGDDQKAEWTIATKDTGGNYVEGVFFPDTYFIPTDEDPALVAERMKDRFKEKFAPYAAQAVKAGIPWTKVLTIASLIQRETGNVSDMHVISGVIENRLHKGMPLAIDATLQYIEGSEENGWWPKPDSASTYPDTPFNTYKRTGLPPHPIAEPGLAAIDAALNPSKTDCLFYLHDLHGQLHCSPSYAGQQANVQKYLR